MFPLLLGIVAVGLWMWLRSEPQTLEVLLVISYGLVGLGVGIWLTLTPRYRHRWHSDPEYYCHGRACGLCWSMVPLAVLMWPAIAIATLWAAAREGEPRT